MLVRKARLQDASQIHDLVNSLSSDGTLLKRAFAEVCENVRDFTVAESDGGIFLGCGALHLYGPHLCEVRSIVVKPAAKGQGAGGGILKALIEEAEEHGVQSVCLFTRIPDFFFKYGFRTAHEKIGQAVRYAIEKGVELGALSLDELRKFGAEFGEDFYSAVTLEATLDCHDVIGGTARARVRQALDAAAERIAALTPQEAAHAGA